MFRSFWRVFSAAPHRMMMFGGAVQLLATVTYWLIELTGRYTSLWAPLPTTVPGLFAHAFLMLYALFPFYIFGFLMTTYPRWMQGEEVPLHRYQSAFLCLAGGVVMFYIGLFLSRWLVIAGSATILLGYVFAVHALWQVFRHARARDKFYERFLNAALLTGIVGISAYICWLLSFDALCWRVASNAGLWWFLLPIVVTVSHRMIPFFSMVVLPDYRVFQPRATVPAMLGLLFTHGLFEILELTSWLWLIDVPLLALTALHSWRWNLRGSFAVRLLAILHIAFAWLSIALALYIWHSLASLLGVSVTLGRAPLHAMTIGFLFSITLAMASRVTLGHSGRELRADTTTWVLFWGLSGVAILRIVAELPHGVHFNLLAALVWLLIAAVWSAKYGRIYLKPRLDGKPG